MVIPLFAAVQALFQILLAVVAVFLILLVLVQRGRGGGLAGALGGMGGSSAFGAKAGDIFTRITIGAAAMWIVLCIAAAKFGPTSAGGRLNTGTEAPISTGPALTPLAEDEKAALSEQEKANFEKAAANLEDSAADEEPAPTGGEPSSTAAETE